MLSLLVFQNFYTYSDKIRLGGAYLLQKEEQQVDPASFYIKNARKQHEFYNHEFREMIPTARLWQPQLIHPI